VTVLRQHQLADMLNKSNGIADFVAASKATPAVVHIKPS
jgi:hypothetical protein